MEDRMESPNLLEIVSAGKYQRALFTTFSLNLSFFESYVLPRLRIALCDDITILVDERFYLESLAEKGAHHVGLSYRLLPVRYETGVFHGKLSYLWSGDGADILTVGSGNLTISGWGKQLECLHVLNVTTYPEAFMDLSEILNDLCVLPTCRCGDAVTILREFADRSRVVAQRQVHSGQPTARLISSIASPISTTVSDRLGSMGPFSEMVVMSPFHDSVCSPLSRLGNLLSVEKISVAIDASDMSTSVDKPPSNVSFVLRDSDQDLRPTHAKWYEFRGARNWLLSGSVNATHTSLETTDNFEVAVLCPVDDAQLQHWIPANPSIQRRDEFEFISIGERCTIYASYDGEENVCGNFLDPSQANGQWEAEAVFDATAMGLGKVEVEEGSFTLRIPDSGSLFNATGQIVLRKDTRTASCWIMHPSMLGMSRAQREFSRRLMKLGSHDGDDDDFLEILAWLADHVGAIGVGCSGVSGGGGSVKSEEGPTQAIFDYSIWRSVASDGAAGHATALGMCRIAFGALSNYQRQKGQGSLRKGGSDTPEFYPGNAGFLLEDDNESESSDTTQSDHLERLELNLQRQLDHVVDVSSTEFLLDALLWVQIRRHFDERHKPLDVVPFLQWAGVASRVIGKLGDTTSASIDKLVVAVVANAIHYAGSASQVSEPCMQLGRRSLRRLGDSLTHISLIHRMESAPAFNNLTHEQLLEIPKVLEEIERYQDPGQRLHAFLEQWRQAQGKIEIPREIIEMLGVSLQELESRRRLKTPFIESRGSVPTACSKCYQSIRNQVAELRLRRGVRCACGMLHFWTGESEL